MDETDERILKLMRGNARISFQELGDKLGMSRVAAMKRVRKLEDEGIIRQYNTCIYRENETQIFIYIEANEGCTEKVLKYVTTRTAYIRQIFRTRKETGIFMVAVSDSVENLNYLVSMIKKKCDKYIALIRLYGVSEVIKDVYGGVGYERKDSDDSV